MGRLHSDDPGELRCANVLINGTTVSEYRLNDLVDSSVTVITALAPVIGYAPAAKLAKEAPARSEPIADLVVEHGVLERDQLSPERLTAMPGR